MTHLYMKRVRARQELAHAELRYADSSNKNTKRVQKPKEACTESFDCSSLFLLVIRLKFELLAPPFKRTSGLTSHTLYPILLNHSQNSPTLSFTHPCPPVRSQSPTSTPSVLLYPLYRTDMEPQSVFPL